MREAITLADVKEIIDLVRSESKLEWFIFKQGDTEISISRNGYPGGAPAGQQPVQAPMQVAPSATPQPAAPVTISAPADAGQPAISLSAGEIAITAPLVGTFYRSPKPGAPPFVEVGTKVAKGDTLCIVEVMKLMNSIKAEAAGTVKQILVEDGKAVEYGQTIIVIEQAE